MNAKKQLGQNFLVDKNKINMIINSLPKLETSTVVEVGPGKGALTIPLSLKAKEVIAIEIDSDMIEILNEKVKTSNFQLINKDILNIEWDSLLKNKTNIQFVSNLPYYISTKIMFKVAYDERFSFMSVMLQKELIDRIFAKLKTKNYGRLTVAIGSLFILKKRIDVPAGCFNPRPEVNSGFIVLERKKIDFNIEEYLLFIKSCFAHKRKTLINSLKNSDFKYIDKVLDFLKSNNIKLNIRSEEINIETFIKIYKSF